MNDNYIRNALEIKKLMQINYKNIECICKQESKRHGWGLILIAREQLKKWILQKKPKTLLDIGCHNRLLEKTIKQWFSKTETLGIDIVKYSEKLSTLCDGSMLPFRNDSFDFITIIETLEHIPNYVNCMYECYRTLKNQGILFIQSVCCISRHAYEGDETHYHVLHPNCLERLGKLIGFKTLEKGMINLTFYIVMQKQ